MTLGTRLKNAPHPIPLKTTNTAKTPAVLENGQMTRALIPANARERRRLLIGPKNVSDRKPATTRPTVEATFQIANMITAIG
jgi:hypothetical protein